MRGGQIGRRRYYPPAAASNPPTALSDPYGNGGRPAALCTMAPPRPLRRDGAPRDAPVRDAFRETVSYAAPPPV
ncbi:hypothetical protein GCM10027028_04110 [Streptomyces sundarbansensis]